MICIPKQMEDRIRYSVKTYKDVMKLMDMVSDSFVDHLMKSKKNQNT